MHAYLKLTLVILTAAATQWFLVRGHDALNDIHLAARAAYVDRFGTDADRAAFDAAVDRIVHLERVRIIAASGAQ